MHLSFYEAHIHSTHIMCPHKKNVQINKTLHCPVDPRKALVISAKEPYISAKEPCISAKEACKPMSHKKDESPTVWLHAWMQWGSWALALNRRRWMTKQYHSSCASCLLTHYAMHARYEWVSDTRMSHGTHEWFMSLMNESCCTRGSHIIREWVMSHMNELCHTCIHEWVMAHRRKSYHKWISRVVHERVMILHLNGPCHTWLSHVSCNYRNETCRTWGSHIIREWVVSHMKESSYYTWMGHVTRDWVVSHMNESCLV